MKHFIFLLISFLIIQSSTLSNASYINTDDQIVIKIDSIELSAFMDGVMKTILEERKIAGASVVIIQGNEVLVKKGYGFADIDNQIRVNPDSTLFRIGSISKLFTWISIMQQIEKGKLELDADINTYLENFKIPETFQEPITIRSLLSHTPGFEDKLLYLFVKSPEEMKSIEEIFQKQMPKRVRPPMKYAAYSNHGTGLAQYLIELKSGQKIEDYADKNIFEPLGLTHTTFRQPLPSGLNANMSKAYAYENSVISEKYFEYIPLAGAGAVSTTAGDMGRFMQSLLHSTCIDTICLLEHETFLQMLEPALYHSYGLNPALHGFMDLSRKGIKIFGHGGDTFWFHSLLAIIPEHKIGFFITFNSFEGGGAYEMVFEKFLERYLPDQRELFDTITLTDDYLQKFTGKYKANRHPHTDFLKLLSIMQTLDVSIDNSRLKMDFPGKETTFWIPIDSVTFRNSKSNELIAFEMSEDNSIAEKLFLGNLAIFAFEKIQWIENPVLHNVVLQIIMVTIIFILFIWPYITLIRRKHQRILPAPQLIPFPAKFVAWIAAACFFIFYLTLIIASANSGQELIMYVPTSIKLALFLPFLAIPFILLMILQAIILWKMKDVKWRSRLFYYFSIVVFTVALLQLYYWNLLGWNY
ncbi:MAG: beta-lactamase family protein [Bacteroidetes bacterium]|nr:beta-lactamase family protein [Bacteroidota bacterium]